MPEINEPRSGLKYGWDRGEDGWNTQMDENILMLGRWFTHLSVIDRDLATPPTNPVIGDTYIIEESPTGAWSGQAGSVTLWDGMQWRFGIPRVGWLAYIEDEEIITIFKANGWSQGTAV